MKSIDFTRSTEVSLSFASLISLSFHSARLFHSLDHPTSVSFTHSFNSFFSFSSVRSTSFLFTSLTTDLRSKLQVTFLVSLKHSIVLDRSCSCSHSLHSLVLSRVSDTRFSRSTVSSSTSSHFPLRRLTQPFVRLLRSVNSQAHFPPSCLTPRARFSHAPASQTIHTVQHCDERLSRATASTPSVHVVRRSSNDVRTRVKCLEKPRPVCDSTEWMRHFRKMCIHRAVAAGVQQSAARSRGSCVFLQKTC